MKAICPRCKSWEYCKFRFLNNKKSCKKLQPRYICRRCNKYFTLGGKLYNTSLHSASKAPIRPNSCQNNFDAASPLYMSTSPHQYGSGHSSIGLHIQPSDSCGMLRTDLMAGTHFRECGGNLCRCSLVNPCSIINSRSNGCFGMTRLPYDAESSDIYGTTCFPHYYGHSGSDLVPFTFLENSSEDVTTPNLGFSHCVNDIPPFNNAEPLMEPLEGSHERDLADIGLLMSEYLNAEKAVNGTAVVGGEEQQEYHIADQISTNLLGREDSLVLHQEMDNILSAGSHDEDEENEWWMHFFPEDGGGSSTGCGSELEDSDRCIQ